MHMGVVTFRILDKLKLPLKQQQLLLIVSVTEKRAELSSKQVKNGSLPQGDSKLNLTKQTITRVDFITSWCQTLLSVYSKQGQ